MNAINATDSHEITLSARLAVLFDMMQTWLPRKDQSDAWELESDIRDLAFDIDRGEKVPADTQPLVSKMSAWMREHCPLDLQEVQIDLAYISNERPTAYVSTTERVSLGGYGPDPRSLDEARDAIARGETVAQVMVVKMHYAEAQAHDAGLDWDFSSETTQAEAWYEDIDGDLLNLLDEEGIDIQIPGNWAPIHPQRRGEPMDQLLEARAEYGRAAVQAAHRSDCRGCDLDRIHDWMQAAYRGQFASVAEYVEEYIRDTGTLSQILSAKQSTWSGEHPIVPESLSRFLTFDYEGIAEDWDHLQIVRIEGHEEGFIFDLDQEIY